MEKLFTELDNTLRRCRRNEVGQPWEDRWSIDDYLAGDCSESQVGQSKGAPDPGDGEQSPPVPLPPLPDLSAMTDSEIAQTASRLLREAALDAFHRAGAADWLHDLATRKPEQFLKFLQRLLPQSIEAAIEVKRVDIPIEMRSTEELQRMILQKLGLDYSESNVVEGELVEASHSLPDWLQASQASQAPAHMPAHPIPFQARQGVKKGFAEDNSGDALTSIPLPSSNRD